MEFDKSRVYTTLNADELEIGSKVIVADNLEDLKYWVVNYTIPKTLVEVHGEGTQYRFEAAGDRYALAYLVSEPEEKKLKWTDLKVGDIITDGELECMVVSIDKRPNAFFRICVITSDGADWLSLSNDGVKDWEKVENDKNN